MAVGAAIVGGNVVGGLINSEAAKDAATSQVEAARQAAEISRQNNQDNIQYARETRDLNNQLLDPFVQVGKGQLQNLQNEQYYRQPTDEDIKANLDPSMAFRQEQANKAIEGSAAARGGLFSGGTGRALSDYNQQLASTEYANAYGRLQNSLNSAYNRTLNTANIGANAITGQVAQNSEANKSIIDSNNINSSNQGNSLNVQGQAKANATLAQGQAWGNIANSIGSGIATQSYLNAMDNQTAAINAARPQSVGSTISPQFNANSNALNTNPYLAGGIANPNYGFGTGGSLSPYLTGGIANPNYGFGSGGSPSPYLTGGIANPNYGFGLDGSLSPYLAGGIANPNYGFGSGGGR